MKQLDLFGENEKQIKIEDEVFDYGKGEVKEESEYKPTPLCDKIHSVLDQLNIDAQRTNDMLRGLIDELQADWTEDEKLQINNPKEYERQQKLRKEQEPIMAKELTVEAIETLKNSKVDGMVVRLPEGQLDRKIYLEVKDKLELIGGKWKGGKVMGFVFNEDPSMLLEQIANGEKRNLKKEFQFFGTPDSLADYLVEIAGIQKDDRVLEPSAGQGAIIKAINRVYPEMMVECFETMPVNKKFLEKMDTAIIIGEDFLQADEPLGFDKIVANPPFSKNQDIDHIRQMYSLLKPKGRLVSIASKHWQLSTNKKELEFKNWLNEIGAHVEEVDRGAFKESGTTIATVIITIDKP